MRPNEIVKNVVWISSVSLRKAKQETRIFIAMLPRIPLKRSLIANSSFNWLIIVFMFSSLGIINMYKLFFTFFPNIFRIRKYFINSKLRESCVVYN